MKLIIYLTTLINLILLLSSCEDEPPTDYIPQYFVEAYLFVGSPIENIILMRTVSVTDSFNYSNALIRDALVKIKEGSNEYVLSFKDDSLPGYYLPDTTIKVKPKTLYKLDIIYEGKTITAQTMTPNTIDWDKPIADTLYYPKDTINPPIFDTLRFSWTKVAERDYYLIRVKSLDTLEYGKYLIPHTIEKNRRIYRPWEEHAPMYNDVTRWGGPIPNTESPVVWSAIKWYGLNEVAVVAPDDNFLNWFIQVSWSERYNYHLSSIKGGVGVFGSASIVAKDVFVYKNQP